VFVLLLILWSTRAAHVHGSVCLLRLHTRQELPSGKTSETSDDQRPQDDIPPGDFPFGIHMEPHLKMNQQETFEV